VVIQPSRRTLSTPARLFLDRFKAEIANIQERWKHTLSTQSESPRLIRRSGHTKAVVPAKAETQ